MKNVAIFENETVVNVIVVDDDYELATNEKEFATDNPAHIGGHYFEGYFYPAQPYPSWLRKSGEWIPPKPLTKPKYLVYWNEDIVDWSDIAQEVNDAEIV